MDVVPVMRPRLPLSDQVVGYLRGMDASRVYSNFGPLSVELERRYAERFNVPASRVATCSSATLGLQGAVAGLPWGSVHCPTYTFAATPMAIVNAGREVVFHDVRDNDWQLVDLEPQGNDAVMPVLPFGAEMDLDRWAAWEHCVVDAAASGGALGRDLSWLPAGWSLVLSLHATKVLGIGEGGVVIFGSDEAAERFRSFTSLGFINRRASDIRGTNAKLPEPSSAYALAALDLWEVEEREWRAARELTSVAEKSLGLSSVTSDNPGVSPYWLVKFADEHTMRRVEASLARAGVESRRWWPENCDRMRAFSDIDTGDNFPVAESLAVTVLGLPFFRDITSGEVQRVSDALARALEEQP